MSYFEAIILALVQGITEFLPISSSAHLILIPELTGWDDQGISFDVAVHFGTLMAVIIYFRRELIGIFKSFFKSPLLNSSSESVRNQSRLGWQIILATLPIVLIGFIAKDWIAGNLRSPIIIGLASIIFGLFLLLADQSKSEKSELYNLTWKITLIIGIAQVFALIPGASRSGVTLTAALMLGLTTVAAAKFSFLLSIPTILGAAILLLKDLMSDPTAIEWGPILIGVLVAFISAYLCIKWFLAIITRMSLTPFVVYRVLLGIALIVLYI